ncbi:MAG TPA: YCF48-related protein [Candidatus Manganitrophaceae bacterium]|nr:YCF48-related protein [Candidatus Manganitrophaceae bacterium]
MISALLFNRRKESGRRFSRLLPSVLFFLLAACSSPASQSNNGTGGGAPAEKVTLAPAAATVPVGRSQHLDVTVTDPSGKPVAPSGAITYSLSNPAVADVTPQGDFVGKEAGTTAVTASVDGVSSNQAAFTVTPPGPASITLTPPNGATLVPRQTLQFTASAKDSAGEELLDAALAWSSSDPTVVGIDPSGLATGIKPGAAQITASARNGSDSAERITSPPTTVTVQPATPPRAAFTASPSSGVTPLIVQFDASGSSTPNGTILSYAWDFGDHTAGSGASISHTYTAGGPYTVTLIVTDSLSVQATATATVTATSRSKQGGTLLGTVGQGWSLSAHVPADLKGVHFVDANTGWVVGLNMAIFKTTDGGNSWVKQDNIRWKGDPPGYPPIPFDVYFIDRNRGWVAGLPELILYTEDGGATWVEQNRNPISPKDGRPYNAGNYCQDFDSEGNCNHYYGTYLRRIRFAPDGRTGFAVGRYRSIFKTTNGGESWRMLDSNWKSPNWDPNPTCENADVPGGPPVQYHFHAYSPHLFGVDVPSPDEVFIVGGAAGTYDCPGWFNTIAHSADGGDTWDFHVDLDRKQRLFDIHFNGDTGWAVGGTGTILNSVDHGKSWQVVNPNRAITAVDLLGLAFPAANQVWVAGADGFIAHSGDGGVSWERQNSKTDLRLERISFIDPLRGWAASHLGSVPRTTTGGE